MKKPVSVQRAEDAAKKRRRQAKRKAQDLTGWSELHSAKDDVSEVLAGPTQILLMACNGVKSLVENDNATDTSTSQLQSDILDSITILSKDISEFKDRLVLAYSPWQDRQGEVDVSEIMQFQLAYAEVLDIARDIIQVIHPRAEHLKNLVTELKPNE